MIGVVVAVIACEVSFLACTVTTEPEVRASVDVTGMVLVDAGMVLVDADIVLVV